MIPSRVWGSFDWASGDTNPNDNKLGTFEPYFPASLAFFGIHALLERKNIQTLNVNMDMLLHKKFSIRASAWKLTRAETSDDMYNTWGGISRFPGGSTNRDLGEVYQIVGSFKMNRHLSIVAGYSYWAAGGFQRETQTTEVKDVNMFALTMSLDF